MIHLLRSSFHGLSSGPSRDDGLIILEDGNSPNNGEFYSLPGSIRPLMTELTRWRKYFAYKKRNSPTDDGSHP